jgi:hypothetical protein
MFLLDNKPLPLDTPFKHNGISYPANWLRLTSLAEKQAIGITEVSDETTSYDDRFYWGVDNPKQLNNETITPESGDPYTQYGLKHQWTAQVKNTTNGLLTQTDWMVIRKAERDVAIPEATATYRAAVLTECTRLVTAISSASTVDALATVVDAQNWPQLPQ